MKYSENNQAKDIVWKRKHTKIAIAIDLPMELWYICPKCKKLSERLDWSEYNWFLYCYECNKDYPTCLCCDDLEKAIDVYLNCVNDAKN